MVKRYAALLVTLNTLSAFGDPFRNLNFEQAITNSLVSGGVGQGGRVGPVVDLLPGWQFLKGTNQLDLIGYNLTELTLGESGGGPNLLGLEAPSFRVSPPINGNFSFEFMPDPTVRDSLTLVQRGDIPADARFLTYIQSGAPPTVSIDGTVIFQPFAAVGYPAIMELDISLFAGRNVELEFSRIGASRSVIDDIAFIVPEPSPIPLATLGLAACVIGWSRRRLVLWCPKTEAGTDKRRVPD